MSRLVEISPEAVAGVRDDLVATRDVLTERIGPLRWRAAGLGVDVSGFDQALGIADRLGTAVLPVVEVHLRRAQDLSALRYGGAFGAPIPVIDTDPPVGSGAPLASMSDTRFTQEPAFGGGTVLSWGPGSAQDQEVDAREASESTSISGWFADRWDEASGAVSDGVDWAGDKVADAWGTVTGAGSAIGDWWESTTADLGAWVDEHGAGVRDFIGRHVGVFRFLASACRVVGWVVVAAGAVLTVALTVIGAMGGAGIGAVFGFGVGAVPGGATGAVAGASFGLKILGAGFSLVSVGDFLDVAADWGQGTIDGQDLVKRGTFELAMVVGSFAGAKLAGKALEKLVTHLPASWRAKAGELVGRLIHRRGPLDDDGMRGPLRAGAAEGRGWKWVADTNPDPLYGQPRADHGTGLNPDSQVPNTVDPEVARIGGNAAHPWGNNPATGEPLTEAQWTARYVLPNGSVRWPPNAGAVPGTRVVFDDADKFVEIYGDQFDRVGGPAGYYLGIPPGTPFVERALPPGLLEMRMHEYVFTGELPPGVTIEISEIAPAFGQPGGGLQVQFMDGASPIRIEDLIDGTYQGTLR